ncbi:MAG: glycosyltransferase [Anaerolineae bacterium]|nr:glycosyltransferase [Phycisphaerae bacterium]
MATHRIIGFSTKGAGSNEEARLRGLLRHHSPEIFPFDRQHKARCFRELLKIAKQRRPDLFVMEGTGVAGGLACLIARALFRTRYVVSSGDAVGPYIRSRTILLAPLFAVYERILCRFCSGFIGWTPYLVGRAMTFGAPRAMTAAGWSLVEMTDEQRGAARERVRRELNIADDDIVIGIAGSLFWSKRLGYCYGYELVRAMERVNRPDVKVLIVGGGAGLDRLRSLAGDRLGKSIFLPGEVPWSSVLNYLSAMDVGSLPQSVDGLGSFRYTTKISEYAAARLPIVTGRLPMAYDLDVGWMWRLRGELPWGDTYVSALAELLNTITREQIAAKRDAIPITVPEFDEQSQVRRATEFIGDLLDEMKR